MIVIDGSILVSPYFEAIVKDLQPAEIVVPWTFRKTVVGPGEAFRLLKRYYGVNDRVGWATYYWAQSRIKEWVDVESEEFTNSIAEAIVLHQPLSEALEQSKSNPGKTVALVIADELVEAVGLRAPIVGLGGLNQPFGRCSIAHLGKQGNA